VAALLVAGGALAQDAGFIVIYHNQPAYSNILRFPAEAREAVKPVIQAGRAELVDWSAFKSDPRRYLAPLVIKNEYPASDLAKELLALLEGNSRLGFAVTWTGGIGVTKEDRLDAERSYALFRRNPDEYERTKVSNDRASDRFHPENRLSQLRPKPQGPWWKCDGDYPEPPATPDQKRRLEEFGLDRFSPKAPGPDRMDESFSRSDLTKSFGQPLRTRSTKVMTRPQDPSDKPVLQEITTWEYPGFTIITVADASSPDVLLIDEGEVLDAKVSLGHGVGVGQSIERWERQFGRPGCHSQEEPPFRHFAYRWEASYFACSEDKTYGCAGAYEMKLYIDTSGRVMRMKWSRASMH